MHYPSICFQATSESILSLDVLIAKIISSYVSCMSL